MRTPKQVYAENVSFEEHNEQTKDRRIKQFKWAAISGWSVALLSALSVSPLLQLQHIIATAIVVDRGTGDYKIERDSMVVVSPGSPDFNQRAVSDLGRFVKAREGFSRAEADANYKTVWLMSSQSLRGQWDAYYKPDLNKTSPLNVFGQADVKLLQNFSYSFLPTSEPGVHVAQVRYDLITQVGQLPPTSQRMVSTVTFKYGKANVPTDLDDYTLNAFGFEVTNYHADTDGPSRTLTPAGVMQAPSSPPQPYMPQPPVQQYPQPAQIVNGGSK
ncbi:MULTISPECIES: type IV secretion system protein [Burkholderia]|jgi:type IV secretory pathway component VirB8|uniref:Type IV secretion system protein n=2 Tax=Burkholderia contaminans TaxID=488447 RepID=A0A1E3FNA3_9BURK|nr:type IV secretion system protein [Burkholderia contaminans]ELK7724877.1 type IV secretion system protein [Burkholderia cenocepacia]UTP27819.1 type IV secretion system protein [Burkholderia sp. FXe9]HBN6128177.1 type IV secretion system protein [Clostridioides difficile]MBA9833412.1 type IV secretion system protein VirB8 [Burkholderia contaminans]MBH9693784.1 type IV secretion system protein [Burkholderia contaminans]